MEGTLFCGLVFFGHDQAKFKFHIMDLQNLVMDVWVFTQLMIILSSRLLKNLKINLKSCQKLFPSFCKQLSEVAVLISI